jgi:TRAP transporter TAXI family solute receptor
MVQRVNIVKHKQKTWSVNTMTYSRKTFLGGLAGLLAAPAVIGGAKARPQQVTFLSGPQGSTWYAIGGGLASMFGNVGVRANSEVGGAITNIIQVSRGEVEAGFTFSAALGMAAQGRAPFPAPITNLRGLMTFQVSMVHVLVAHDSGVERVEDLRGRPFASQAPGNLSQVAFADLLGTAGLSESDLRLSRGSQTHGGDGVKDRRFVGVTALSGVPGPMFMDVATSLPVRLLPVSDAQFERLREVNPGYSRMTIPAGTYPGQDELVPTFGTTAVILVHEDMSDDDAYFIIRTIGERLDQFRGMAAANAFLTHEIMSQVKGADLHPGAQRYYREVGVLS